MRLLEFERTTNAFNYVFERDLKANETIVVKMPVVSANKRGINDIGWQTDGNNIKLFGTMSKNCKAENTMWQEIPPATEINKTISALKIVNEGENTCRFVCRVILN